MPVSRAYAVTTAAGTQPRRSSPPDPNDLTPKQFARREKIIQAALLLLMEHPYDQVQIRDVAEAADLAPGTVYRYFASKEHLFVAVQLAWQDRFRRQLETDPPQSTSPRDRLRDIAFRAIRTYEREPNFYAITVMSRRTSDHHARTLAYRELIPHSEAIFAGPLPEIPPEDRNVIVMLIGAMLDWELGAWLAGAITIDEVHDRMGRTIDLLKLPD